MNTSAHYAPQPASRLTGLALAAGVHVVLILGFASAFVIQGHPKPPAPPVVDLVDDPATPPPPVQRVPVPDPKFNAPTVNEVPMPPFEISQATTPTVFAVPESNTVRDFVPSPVPLVAAQTKPRTGPQDPGAVCTKMSAPIMPSVNGSGEALFRVTASTQAGRVNSIEIQALRNSMDGRSLRAFKSSIEAALREGYVCPGNVSFVQEFQFRLD